MIAALIASAALTLAPQNPTNATSAAKATADEVTAIPSAIVDVVVYPGTAMVRRSAELPAGDGRWRLTGLPIGFDPDSLRVRLQGGEVVSVETRESVRGVPADPRLAPIEQQMEALQREMRGLQDRRQVLVSLAGHLRGLMQVEQGAHAADLAQGRPSTEAWSANLVFLERELLRNAEETRKLEWQTEDLQERIQDLDLQRGDLPAASKSPVREVLVDVVARAGGPMALELEYLVGGAGWEPTYDLRTDKGLKSVELIHRARVWQQSGEDWREVEIALSTAQPQRGAQGPDPQPVWVALADPAATGRAGLRRGAPAASAPAELEEAYDAAAGENDMFLGRAGKVFADIADEGLSLRYKLPRRETVESRPQPSTVLVGRETLPIRAERVCVPALDSTVWLRGETKNETGWVLLPGRAAVYFGSDFIGHAAIGPVQRGEEFTLHLGPDPGLVVERTKVSDLKKGSGFFSNKSSVLEGWTIEIKNLGAAGTQPGEEAEVVLREVLPRSRDDRLQVSLEDSTHKLSDDERWKKDREEQGILTWVIRVPREKPVQLRWSYTTSFPEGMVVQKR